MLYLKQSTAINILMGPALDATDGVTEETGLSPTVYLSKNGGAQAARNSASAISHDALGYYIVPLDATDTGTLGRLRALFHDNTTHLPVWHDFMVIPANVYDSIVSGSDLLDVNASQLGGTAQTGNDVGADVDDILVDTAEIGAAGAGLTDVGLATAVKAALVDDIWDEPLTGATHNVATSSGRRLRSQGDAIGSTVNDASATTTSFVSALAGAGYDDDHFADQILLFLDGSLAGQCRPIYTYVDSTGVFTFEEAFTQAPGDGDAFDIIPNHIHSHAQIQEDAGAGVAAEVVETEGSYTVQQVLSIVLSVLAGVTASNGATLKTPDGAATRVAATIDANANRTAMTLTPSS